MTKENDNIEQPDGDGDNLTQVRSPDNTNVSVDNANSKIDADMQARLRSKDAVWVSLVISTVLVLIHLLVIGKVFDCVTTADYVRVFSDAFSTSGVLLMSYALLVMISNHGGFTMLSYGAKNALHMLIPQPKYKHINYYDYVQRHKAKPKQRIINKVIVSGCVLVVGIVLGIIYNYV